jgi:hypothetical protein
LSLTLYAQVRIAEIDAALDLPATSIATNPDRGEMTATTAVALAPPLLILIAMFPVRKTALRLRSKIP